LFGGFRVAVATREVPEEAWRRRRPAALLKLLALAAGHRLHREQVMDALWPELDPRAAAANLRKALHHARRALDPAGGERLIASVGELLCLPSEGLWVDVDAFRAAVAHARRSGDQGAYAQAIELYRDGLLPADRMRSGQSRGGTSSTSSSSRSSKSWRQYSKRAAISTPPPALWRE
jgi:DNA-binding SARP family transcriptional activator